MKSYGKSPEKNDYDDDGNETMARRLKVNAGVREKDEDAARAGVYRKVSPEEASFGVVEVTPENDQIKSLQQSYLETNSPIYRSIIEKQMKLLMNKRDRFKKEGFDSKDYKEEK